MVLIDGELDVGEDFVLTNVILARRGGGMFDLQVSCIQIDTVQCTQAALGDGKDTIQSGHFFFFFLHFILQYELCMWRLQY